MKNIRAASVQFQPAAGNKPANLNKIQAFVAEAAARQVDLIAFPEMCITGYWHVRKLALEEIEALAEPIPSGHSTEQLLSLSNQHNLTIGAGLIVAAPAHERVKALLDSYSERFYQDFYATAPLPDKPTA